MDSSKSKRYAQKFRMQWLKDPLLKDWLSYEDVELGDEKNTIVRRPSCIYCQHTLSIRYMDLTKHTSTAKHMKNSAKRSTNVRAEKRPLRCEQKIEAEEEQEEEQFKSPEETLVEYQDEEEDSHMEVTEVMPVPRAAKRSVPRNLIVTQEGDVSLVVNSPQPPHHPERHATEEEIRMEQLRVRLEQEKVKLYLLRLDALEKETSLGMPRSSFTRELCL